MGLRRGGCCRHDRGLTARPKGADEYHAAPRGPQYGVARGVTIQQRVWGGARFVDGPQKTYRRTDGLWHHADAEAIVAA